MMYGLSTCVWRKKTKQLLTELGVDFDYVYVDKLDKKEEDEVIQEIKLFNPSISFPTVIIDRKRAIIGFNEMELREALSL